MGKFSVKVFGAKRTQRKLLKSGGVYAKALGMALHVEAMEIFSESQDLVPVKESILQGSGVVTKVKFDATGDPYVEIGYGTKYALPVHEMSPSNNFTKSGTGPKYLQRPFEKRMIGWKRRVALHTQALAAIRMKLA